MISLSLEEVIGHLGGKVVIDKIGADDFVVDDRRVSFVLSRHNPKNVRTVSITIGPDGRFAIDCFAAITPGTFYAPLVASAREIVPENLATVLGQLTGIETIHHRHF